MTVKVPGRPKGKARPRFGNGRTYTPKTTIEYEDLIARCYVKQDGRTFDGEVKLKVEAVFKIPESWTKKKKHEAIFEGKRPEVRPDIDNIVKVVMDALSGVAYNDDSQVVIVEASKMYGLGCEGLLITLEGLDE